MPQQNYQVLDMGPKQLAYNKKSQNALYLITVVIDSSLMKRSQNSYVCMSSTMYACGM